METCDRCGPAVSAMYTVRMIAGELSFCGHHYNEYKEVLDKQAYEVVNLSIKEEELVEAE